jgi:hypothetical protein
MAVWAVVTRQSDAGNIRDELALGMAQACTTVAPSAGPKLEPLRTMTVPPAALAPKAPGPLRLLITGGAYDSASALALLAPPSTVTETV